MRINMFIICDIGVQRINLYCSYWVERSAGITKIKCKAFLSWCYILI